MNTTYVTVWARDMHTEKGRGVTEPPFGHEREGREVDRKRAVMGGGVIRRGVRPSAADVTTSELAPDIQFVLLKFTD